MARPAATAQGCFPTPHQPLGRASTSPRPSSQLPAPSSQLPAPSSQLPAPSSQLPTPELPGSGLPNPICRLPTADYRLSTADSPDAAMSHMTAVNEPFLLAGATDLAQATRTHVQGRWQISSRKLPISRAGAIDAMAARVGIPIPEMIFGDNRVAVQHVPSGWALAFDAADALDLVDKTGHDRLQVAYARDWARSRETAAVEGIADVRPFDWSYSTTYKGTETPAATATATAQPSGDPPGDSPDDSPDTPALVNGVNNLNNLNNLNINNANTNNTHGLAGARLQPAAAACLPIEQLRRRDPILFHDDVILYESELDDNGISMLRVKLRVMPRHLLLLCRLYMRLDHVVVRVRDTRVCVDFATDEVLREYTAREDAFARVQQNLARARGLRPDAVVAAMRDADLVVDLLPVVERTMERLVLPGGVAPALPAAAANGADGGMRPPS